MVMEDNLGGTAELYPSLIVYLYIYVMGGFFVFPNPIVSSESEERMAVGQPQRIPNICD